MHVKRNPAAVCWGNFKQYFVSQGLGYSYDIDDIINYYKLYENLMGLWEESMSDKIYHIDYDSLTVNQVAETKSLISYLGLRWEDACLSPEGHKRKVATASNAQVRQRIYRNSSREWTKYRPFLNGILDDLDNSSLA